MLWLSPFEFVQCAEKDYNILKSLIRERASEETIVRTGNSECGTSEARRWSKEKRVPQPARERPGADAWFG